MASRLFQAVVGVGIAMGGTLAACGDVTSESEPDASADAASAADAPTKADVTSQDGGQPDVVVVVDGGPTTDAALDAPQDAILDAFCDAPWPTTKGSPPVPTCVDPQGTCALDGSFPFACATGATVYTCEYGSLQSSQCIDGQWQCEPGKRKEHECICFVPTPSGWECTDAGLVPVLVDAGGGG